jgi:type I restriction enzyme S subunit
MRLNQITSNLDVFTHHKGGIGALKDFFLSSAFQGNFTTHSDADNGTEFFEDLQKCGSNYDRDKELSKNDLSGIWEAFSLYELPKSWKWMRLDQVGTIIGGGTPDTANNTYWAKNSGTPWITPADMRNQSMFVFGGKRNLTDTGLRESSSKLLPVNSVVFSSRAPIGYVGISGVPLATNQGFKSCVPFIPEMAKFIYFYLIFMGTEINRRATGTTFKEVSGKQFAATPIPIPPLRIQQSIVESIEEFMSVSAQADDKILQRVRLASSARESAVDAISTAQSPEELHLAWKRIQGNWQVIAGTPESIESLRELILDILLKPKRVDDWNVKSFGDLLTISNGDRSKNYPSKEYRVSTGIPFVNAGHLKDGLIDLTDMDYISREKFESLSGGKFMDGDILFCLRGSLGKSALVKDIGEGAIASSLAIFKVGVEIDTDYLFWFLQSGMARIQIKKFDNGTAQPNLSAKSVLKFQIPLPNLPEQKSIVLKVGELMKLCEQLEQKMILKENIAHKFARSVISNSA